MSEDYLLLVDLMTVETNLDVRGLTVTKFELSSKLHLYLPLEVTHKPTRDGAGQVQLSGKKISSMFLSVFVQELLTRTGKTRLGVTQLQDHWQPDMTYFIK